MLRRILFGLLSLILVSTMARAGTAPLAEGAPKFLGSAYSPPQTADFAAYWNKVTPENAGKWGEVEAVRDVMNWAGLDDAYQFAKQHDLPFHMHVMVWGNQQPEWMETLPREEQREEIEEWFAAVAERYSDLDFVEVVNEPLHDPPAKDDDGGGNYIEALGGAGASGWDWILESFRLARTHFPRAKLLINDYSITNTPASAAEYRKIIDLLHAERLLDGIGVQAHAFSTTTETPVTVHRAALDLLAGSGLPIFVTEMDIDGPTDAEQLRDIQRVFPLFWEHPAVRGVTLWGFRPGLWRDPQGAYLVRADGSERPALIWLRDYLSDALPDCSAAAAVCAQPATGALALISDGRALPVLVDAGDHAGVQRAARSVQQDLWSVAGLQDAGSGASTAHAIIAGTLGHSPRIDRIVRDKAIDVSELHERWEAYLIQVVDAPEPGIERALLIIGSDKRGSIFGLYELARRIGVSPWTFWADVPIARQPELYIAPGRHVDAPRVRYRGIFLNDEDPALGGWMRATYGGPNHKFYERVFELILRLKGNTLWPAMWGRAFADDDPQNPKRADEFGVVIGTSHHEPMMRAHVEWARHGAGPWDYTRNGDQLRTFWRQGIERMGAHESLVTLGMRGDGDEPMTEDTAIDLLERIVRDQREILADVRGSAAERAPQVWALYKEVQDYFDNGMQVPDDVTLLFADDNWGNIRRLPESAARRDGGYGVYYHFDYVGGPRNYKWLNTTQIERTWEQMQRAWELGVERLWIVNVGDLKPMELPIAFFLDMAWNPDAMRAERLRAYAGQWAAQQFGRAHSAEIGDILDRYTQYNARRKPELLSADSYSLTHFDDAERVLAEWTALADRAQSVGSALAPEYRDAYYQLVEYPVLASANLSQLYIAVARNQLYADQGRASANRWAQEARRLFARDAELARRYEQDIAAGKWIHMMSQPRIGYTHWQQPDRNVMPALASVDVRERGTMGVAIAGDPRGWPVPAETARLPTMDPISASTREIVVFNRGSAGFGFTAKAAQPWLRVEPRSAVVEDEVKLRIEVDWKAVPPGQHTGEVFLAGDERTEVRVLVPIWNPSGLDRISGYVESDGHVAVEAAHYARAVTPAGAEWKIIPNLGRTLSGVTPWPMTATEPLPGRDGSARLEYPIWLQASGEIEVRVIVSPTLDVHDRGGLRFALSIDDATPQVLTVKLDPTPGHADFQAWQRAVRDSVHVASSRHLAPAGAQTLKLWMIDPGLVFQRIEIFRGPAPSTFLGPPESVRR